MFYSLKLNILIYLYFLLGYVWFSKNLKKNTRERKYKGKVEGK